VTRMVATVAGEADPHYRRILRAVKDTIQVSGEWTVRHIFRGTVVYRLQDDAAGLHLPEMPEESILSALLRQNNNMDEVTTLMYRVFEVLEAQEDFCRACSFLTLTSVIKRFYHELALSDADSQEVYHPEGLGLEIDLCVSSVVKMLRTGLLQRYAARGVLDPAQCEKIVAAAQQYCLDTVAKGPRRLFDYYQEQFPEIEYTSYRKNGRKVFEYAMQSVKENFEKCMRSRLGF
jgi:hypothetical protein